MKKGFTLTEILVTVVVAAILAALALPNFQHSVERQKANQAVAYLRTIRTGERMYHAKWGTYYIDSGSANILTYFGAETANPGGYTFQTLAPTTGTIATGFRAVATDANSKNMILKEDGSCDASSTSPYTPTSC